MATLEVETAGLTDLIADLTAALGDTGKPADISDALRDETRRLAVEIVKDTPPQTKAIGDAAVKRDINRIFSGATTDLIDEIGSAHGIYHVDTFISDKDGSKTHLVWDRIDPEGNQMESLHHSFLQPNGKVPKAPRGPKGEWKARVVVPYEAKEKYLSKIQARVGRGKASWALIAIILGVTRVAGWIKNHIQGGQTKYGTADATGLMNGAQPGVVFGSHAPGVMRQYRVIQGAVKIRGEAIKRRIRLIYSGYSKDVANGMKVSRKESRSGNGGRYSIG